ncbi:hypothetical protein [Pseudomonas azadiae]|uniref:Uncharacterized protein n=1 Tax=Pseudomonas azadiae TaxID=2843612 RepID=A0ABS6P5J1_9PSED|nr:hypothetical protein [Pseudomonas azadiae]MBV4455754.1 hypothetical protein [Pseudomonas azadiae]
MQVTTTPTALSKQTDARVIRNPTMVTNAFTLTEESKAAETLKLKQQEKIAELKTFLKDYDMTSISTYELKKVGRRLYEADLIDVNTFGMFISGDGASDENGHQTKQDVKFNAIALFNEKYEDQLAYFSTDRYSTQESVTYILGGMKSANQAINALAYFANSAKNTLAVDEFV